MFQISDKVFFSFQTSKYLLWRITGEFGTCCTGAQPSTGDPRGMKPGTQEQIGLPAPLTIHCVDGPHGDG